MHYSSSNRQEGNGVANTWLRQLLSMQQLEVPRLLQSSTYPCCTWSWGVSYSSKINDLNFTSYIFGHTKLKVKMSNISLSNM